MESNSNPYASPSSPIGVSAEPPERCPTLPLSFRPSLLTFAYILPIGFVALGTTSLFVLSYMFTVMESTEGIPLFDIYTFIAIVVLLFGGFLAFACLMSITCRVVLSDSSIDIFDIQRRIIQYSEIESWHHHPVTSSVSIAFKSEERFLLMNNWAMSRKKSKLLGCVLREKVGPPSG